MWCICAPNHQLVTNWTFSTRVHLEHMYKCWSRLLPIWFATEVTIHVFHSLIPGAKRSELLSWEMNPVTSHLSFECSNNWATWEFMSFLSMLIQYPVTLCDVFVHLTIRRWLTTFSTRVHLEHMYKCSSRLLECDLVKKSQYMSLTVSCQVKYDQNSSSRKWTWDLSFKLWVLYQLSLSIEALSTLPTELLGNLCLCSPCLVTIQWPYVMCLCT